MIGELRIQTPEGISFSYRLAGPVARCLAWIVDLLVIIVLSNGLTLLARYAGVISMDTAQALAIVGYFVVSIGYSMAAEWSWRGQTVGKRLLHLRVMDAQGMRLQFHQIAVRNLLRFVDMLPACYLLGGLSSLLSARSQRLGDLAANTVVVYLTSHTEPDLDQLLAGKFNSLRTYPHLAARLRQRTSPDEARLAWQALLRRGELEPAARIIVFHEMAAHFKEIVAFPPEAVEAMPDEQYVRNVVDLLFRARETAQKKPENAPARAPADPVLQPLS